MVDVRRQKIIGRKYIVLLLEFYESVGHRGMKGNFKDGEVAVFKRGITKGLQRRENFNSKIETRRTYESLSSIKKVEAWISKRGY